MGKYLRTLFVEHVQSLPKKKGLNDVPQPAGIAFIISLKMDLEDEYAAAAAASTTMRTDTDESYKLQLKYNIDQVIASQNVFDSENWFQLDILPQRQIVTEIEAKTYFGFRHGFETLFQLVEYDNVANSYVVIDEADIEDWPEFRHRGIMLDTAKNFIEVDVIQRILDAMAMNKMNVLHWHFVDSQSSGLQ